MLLIMLLMAGIIDTSTKEEKTNTIKQKKKHLPESQWKKKIKSYLILKYPATITCNNNSILAYHANEMLNVLCIEEIKFLTWVLINVGKQIEFGGKCYVGRISPLDILENLIWNNKKLILNEICNAFLCNKICEKGKKKNCSDGPLRI